jgi:uncharacterized protein DUF1501
LPGYCSRCSVTEPFEIPTLKLPHDLSPWQIRSRRDLLGRLDSRAGDPKSGEMARRHDAFWEQAMDLLVDSRVRDAFHLARESQPVRERYGAHEWGQGALLARRLVEAGVTFVMLQCGLRQDWDTHAGNFSKLRDELLPPLDRAVSAFLDDLRARGLLEKTLVLVMGEFGRTPTVNHQSGRDHWASVFSTLVAGGGSNGGQLIGSSDRTGSYPRDRALHAQDLFATMYHALGIDHTTVFHDRLGRPIPVLEHASPIRELL